MTRIFAVLFSLALLANCARGSTGVITSIGAEGPIKIDGATIAYYDIYGDSEDALRNYLSQHSPVYYNGRAVDAITNWYIGWWWEGYGTETCDLTTASVWYRAIVVFPRWSPPSSASEMLSTQWQAYSLALAQHELGHIEIAKAGTSQILNTIKSATCESAEKQAQSKLAEIRRLDEQYDKETDYGATQGARFP